MQHKEMLTINRRLRRRLWLCKNISPKDGGSPLLNKISQ